MGTIKLTKIKGDMPKKQVVSSDQLDALANVYGGVKLSLSDSGEPLASIDVSGLNMPTVGVNGCYADAKDAVEEKFNTTVENSGTEYIRILDEEVVRVLNTNGVGGNGKITKAQAEAVSELTRTWFADNADIVAFDELNKFTGVTALGLQSDKYNAIGGFQNCTSLRSISLANIQTIGANTFFGCTALRFASLPNTVTFIGRDAFYNVTFEDGFKLPESCTELLNYSNNAGAFSYTYGYIHLNKVQKLNINTFQTTYADVFIVPNTITEYSLSGIGFGFGRSFMNLCKVFIWQDGGIEYSLESTGSLLNYTTSKVLIDLPSTLTVTGSSQLWSKAREYSIMRMTTPPEMSTNNSSDKANAKIFVYSSCIDAYKAADTWKNYNIYAIGGDEWVAAMKDLYNRNKERSYNCCKNVTDDGYTRGDVTRSWSYEYADYDIYGV